MPLNANGNALPKHVHMVRARGREYWYFQIGRGLPDAGPRIRIHDPWNDGEIAAALKASGKRQWDRALEQSCISAKTRATMAQVPYSIDFAFVAGLLAQQGYRCAVSGLPFEVGGYTDCRAHPFGPSLDRIDPVHGYTKSNVRLVCWIANAAMSDWGLAALEKLAAAMVEKNDQRTPTVKRV